MPQEESPKRNNSKRLEDSNISDEGGLMSLHGDSKKIPVNLPNDKLSMSQLSDFARETQYFKNDYKSPGLPQKKTKLNVSESIAEVDEDHVESRARYRKKMAS